jgi:hypothetical protein
MKEVEEVSNDHYSIKSNRKGKKTKSSDLMLTHSLRSMVMDRKQGSFIGIRFSVGRLKRIQKLMRGETISKTRFDDLLIQLKKRDKTALNKRGLLCRDWT